MDFYEKSLKSVHLNIKLVGKKLYDNDKKRFLSVFQHTQTILNKSNSMRDAFGF